MRKLGTVALCDLLPPPQKSAPDAIAESEAVAAECRRLMELVRNVLVFAGVDDMPADWLDEFAADMHVDFYDRTLSVERKRELVHQSIAMHRKKGTPWAVEQLITIIFGEGHVEEWFEYCGEPYHFRVYSSNHLATPEDVRRFLAALNSVKNLRSVLDDVLILRTWGEVMKRDYLTWGRMLGQHTWSEHAEAFWSSLQQQPWLNTLCENSWGNIYSYVWEGLH